MTVSGDLIAESLKVGAVLDAVPLTVRRIKREDAGDVSVGQPLTWTFVEFEAPLEAAETLAGALSEALDPSLGWYCDFRSPDETFVVRASSGARYETLVITRSPPPALAAYMAASDCVSSLS